VVLRGLVVGLVPLPQVPLVHRVYRRACRASSSNQLLGVQINEGPVSAAGGLDRVPADNTLAVLHRDEAVVPAIAAEPLRATTTADAVAHPGGRGGR
jgi:hypothetical protein